MGQGRVLENKQIGFGDCSDEWYYVWPALIIILQFTLSRALWATVRVIYRSLSGWGYMEKVTILVFCYVHAASRNYGNMDLSRSSYYDGTHWLETFVTRDLGLLTRIIRMVLNTLQNTIQEKGKTYSRQSEIYYQVLAGDSYEYPLYVKM
jgi:hypothetical protein